MIDDKWYDFLIDGNSCMYWISINTAFPMIKPDGVFMVH